MDLLDLDFVLPRRSFELRAALTLGTEAVALIGRSGAGKSSLLRAVAGLERPRSGRIVFGEESWFDAGRRIDIRTERRRVGYLPQDYGLFPHLTVAANVRFAAKCERPDLLERVGVAHLAAARPHELSGGERQRVALARALARDPRVLLLDEPFGALDPLTRARVRDELADLLTALELPTLVVTHSFEDATAVAHRIGVIDQGSMLQLAAASELLREPATALVAALTGANVVDGTAMPRPCGGSTIRLAGGGELTSATPARGRVQVAIQPWELGLVDPQLSSLTDSVVSVHQDHGRLIVRLTRFTIQTGLERNGGLALAEGHTVGLRAWPGNVRVLGPETAATPGSVTR